jgi:hypothetical protein
MNIDERIEALTHHIEVLVQRQNSHDDNLNRLFDLQSKNEEMQARNEKMLAGLMESVNSLARIALSHENRLSDLEGLN